ncbi:MAG: helix-turn-helix domain-containing protein [Pseudonocardiaceae bacterium]
MSIRRGPRPADNFAMISNDFARDHRLTFKARGIGLYLLTHADGFRSTTASIAKANGCGLDQVRAGLQELETFGYLVRERTRNDSGHNADTDYLITDQPQDGEPLRGETQRRVLQRRETPAHKKTKGLEDQPTVEDQSLTPEEADASSATAPDGAADGASVTDLFGRTSPPASKATGSTRSRTKTSQDEQGASSARDVVAAWVDAFKANGVKPSQQRIKQVGREAKALIEAGNPVAGVVAAARSAASRGFATVDQEFSLLAARASGNARAGGGDRRGDGYRPFQGYDDDSIFLAPVN